MKTRPCFRPALTHLGSGLDCNSELRRKDSKYISTLLRAVNSNAVIFVAPLDARLQQRRYATLKMNETTHSLAHYGWAALKWESYYLHVLATTDRRSKERPRVPGPITFFTYWRCVTYLVCLILLNIVSGATS